MIGRSDGHGGGGGDVGGGCGHTRTDTVYVGVYSLGREQCCAVPGPAAPSCGHLDAPPGALTPDSLRPGGESGPHRTSGSCSLPIAGKLACHWQQLVHTA